MYEAQDKQGFKLFGNGNLTSNYYALLLKDSFSRGNTESFKLTIDLTPIEDENTPGIKFYEIKKIVKETADIEPQQVVIEEAIESPIVSLSEAVLE